MFTFFKSNHSNNTSLLNLTEPVYFKQPRRGFCLNKPLYGSVKDKTKGQKPSVLGGLTKTFSNIESGPLGQNNLFSTSKKQSLDTPSVYPEVTKNLKNLKDKKLNSKTSSNLKNQLNLNYGSKAGQNIKDKVVSITYEEIGLFPRSFSRVIDRFLKQIFSDVENLVIQEYRFYRYLFLTTIQTIFVLIFVPLFVNFIAKTYLIRPVTEFFWNTKQTEIFLNSYEQKRAFIELQDFEEKLYFESLLTYGSILTGPTLTGPILYGEVYGEALEKKADNRSTQPEALNDAIADQNKNNNLILQNWLKGAWFQKNLDSLNASTGIQSNNVSTMETSKKVPGEIEPIGVTVKIPFPKNIDFVDSPKQGYSFLNHLGFSTETYTGANLDLAANQLNQQNNTALPEKQNRLANTGKQKNTVTSSSTLRDSLAINIPIADGTENPQSGSLSQTSLIQQYKPNVAIDLNNLQANKNQKPLEESINSIGVGNLLQIAEGYKRLQEKTVELAIRYNNHSIESITNFFADFLSLLTLLYLLVSFEIQINITKSFLLEVFFGLDDSKKSLLILIMTDLLVGYHSSNLWELFFQFLFNHYGIPESQTGIFLLVATLPVLLDVLFKYLIFRHLNRASPATVATYHAIIE